MTIIDGMDTKELQGIGFFSGLSKQELKRLAQWTDEVTVDEGYALAKEGAVRARVLRDRGGNRRRDPGR